MERYSSSFRDPSGFIFTHHGEIYRQINNVYKKNYELLLSSGLYDALCVNKYMVKHEEVCLDLFKTRDCYKILKPERISFISYPYEWSFSQLKDAALLTLRIQKMALSHGMILKDASAYNVQFQEGQPIFIDTLSFKEYQEGTPWLAYNQFCQHFLAPLLLMSKKDVRTMHLLKHYVDGIPLDLTSDLLPFSSYFSLFVYLHVHLHARLIKRYERRRVDNKNRSINKFSLLAIMESLFNLIKSLEWEPARVEWAGYYNDTNYTEEGLGHKRAVVEAYMNKINPGSVWDFGGNTGYFTRIASERRIACLCFDVDPAAVEKNYQMVKKQKEKYILPLVFDLTNPSPALGWGNIERKRICERGHADLLLALALIHHICLVKNIPLDAIAKYFALHGDYLIIEFVSKEDSRVQQLLSSREDIYPDYTQENFEKCFSKYYKINECVKLADASRYLYLMNKLK